MFDQDRAHGGEVRYNIHIMTLTHTVSKAAELLERVSALSLQERRDSALLLRLSQEAEAMRSSDSLNTITSLAWISLYQNRIQEARNYYESALKQFPDEYMIHLNYAASLCAAGFFTDAYLQARLAHNINPKTPACVQLIIHILFASGRPHDALPWNNFLNKMKPHGNTAANLTGLDSIIKYMNTNNIGDDDFEVLQKKAFSVLHKNGVYFTNNQLNLLEDEDSQWISYEIFVDKPVAQIVNLNIKHAESLAYEAQIPKAASKITFIYTSWRDE
ncbi:MAG: hypothetical protein HZB29_07620 [Nitrospinae bacterium]|nr:hypothetical protein [Nitrospinota bacterium]